MEANGDGGKQELDPADYLLQTTKYHDRHITVGNPDIEQMEIFGVSSSHLASHSTVFREMLVESELADCTGKNTHITDVSPEVFKLMLRHIYGGKFPGDISRETTAALALCADKYNIQLLVSRAAALLIPTTVQQVFVALRPVVYINAPELENHVVTFIQKQTDKIIADKEFLLLDPNCLELIAKQDKLTVTELGLWKGLLKWAKHQTGDPGEMRRLLEKPLRHVRFLSLTKDEFVEEVMPSKVLSSEESVDLLLAISSKKPLQINGFSTTKNKRASVEKASLYPEFISLKKNYQFQPNKDALGNNSYDIKLTELQEYAATSNLTIRTHEIEIELHSFVCKARRFVNFAQPLYSFRCDIKMFSIIDGFNSKLDSSAVEGQAVSNENIKLQLAFQLKKNSSYNIVLQFSSTHPVFTSSCFDRYNTQKYIDSTYEEKRYNNLITVQFNSPFHVQSIHFKG